MSKDVQVYQNIVARWKEELSGEAGNVLLFSPFITPTTIYTILENAIPENCEIYTVFNAEYYASGSSSIKAIKKLAQEGVVLYHLEGLHAKIVLKPEGFASVGSQNITGHGTRSLEMSVSLSSLNHIRQVDKKIKKWIENRVLITMTMIVEMEDNLKNLKSLYKTFFEESQSLDEKVKAAERVRQKSLQLEAERERVREQQELRAATLLKLKTALNQATKADYSKLCVVRDMGGWSSTRYSLVPSSSDASLTTWRVKGDLVNLAVQHRLDRFLCIIENSGKIGWLRLGKKVITFVSAARYGTATIAGRSCFLFFVQSGTRNVSYSKTWKFQFPFWSLTEMPI